MGYGLRQWALDVQHASLTARTRQVLAAICMVAHDEHGEFYMRGQKFVSENFPDMSYSAYRNHLTTLVKNGLLLKTEHGGGRTVYGGGTTTRYRVNSPKVQNPHPPQTALPDIVKSPEAQPSTPEVNNEPAASPTIEVFKRVEALLAAGITPEQMLAILRAVQESLAGSVNLSEEEGNLSEEEGNLSDSRGNLSENERNPSEKRTGLDEKPDVLERNLSDFGRNLSGNRTSYPIREDKRGKKEDYAAAAENLSDSTDESRTGFFELLTTTLADAGHPGIRAAQFADLSEFLQDYTNQTGSPPDQQTAEYIVGRVSETAGIRNVAAFVRRLARDVLTTGEGYVALDSAPAPQPSRSTGPSPPPDWNLLHLAHGDQVSSAQEIWSAVLDVLRGQVSRPAFETWLTESNGAAYAEGKFVVGSANSFASEMLRNRMDPLIKRAVRDVTQTEVIIEYAVVASDDRRECPLCQAGETKEASASS